MAHLDDGPNFAYAFAASSSSWNPAFRPDHESPQKSTFDHSQLELRKETNIGSEIDEDGLPSIHDSQLLESNSATWAAPSHLLPKEPTSDDDFFDRYGTQEVPHTSALGEQHHEVQQAWEAIEEGPVAAITDPDETATRMDTLLGVAPQQSGLPELSQHQLPIEEIDGLPAHAPSQDYDYQGESTTFDQAIREDPESPLLASESPLLVEAATTTENWSGGEWAPDAKQELLLQEDEFLPEFESQSEKWDALTAHLPLLSAESPATRPMDTIEEVRTAEIADKVAEQEADIDWGASGHADFDFEAGAQTMAEDNPKPSDIFVAGTPLLNQANGEQSQEEDISAMWAATLDDDEFLTGEAAEAFAFDVDDGDDFLAENGVQDNSGLGITDSGQTVTKPEHTRNISAKYTPSTAQLTSGPIAPSNAYLPQAPQFTDLSNQSRSQPAAARVTAVSPYQSVYAQQQPQRPELPSTAQSFVDKAKGGYSSPYDLPEDLSVKKRRPIHHVPAPPQIPHQTPQPPPRSSSMTSAPTMPPPFRPQPPQPSYSANFTALSSSYGAQASNGSAVTPQAAPSGEAKPPKSSSTGFFEDLPVVHRPVRHATPSGRYTPQIGPVATPPPQILSTHPASHHTGPPPPRPISAQYPSAQYSPVIHQGPPLTAQLQAPARMLPYAEEQDAPNNVAVLAPLASSRYSPSVPSGPVAAPTHASLPPPPPLASSRYSPAPGSKPQASDPASQISYNSALPPSVVRSNSLPYAPRTSSPLAYHSVRSTPHHTPSTSTTHSERADPSGHPDLSPQGRLSMERNSVSQPALGTVAENEPYSTPPSVSENTHSPRYSVSNETSTPPPPSKSVPSSAVSSPRKRPNYAPTSYQPTAPTNDSGFIAPRRSQTSSPGASLKNPRLAMTNFDRPASAQGAAPTVDMGFGVPTMIAAMQQKPAFQEMNMLAPQDDRVHDPLERWRGAPIFRWGIGSSIVTSFPKYIPRYITGQMGPLMQPSQVEVRTRNINEVSPPAESFLKFPGPLKKGKKKEILGWLKATTEAREAEHQKLSMHGELTAAAHQRSEEKLLLRKIMMTLVENDGALEGTSNINEAVRKILSPATSGQDVTADAFGITQSAPVKAQPEAFDPAGVNVLRNHLYGGQRENAVWYAVDQRLWAHALLIAQTIDNKDIWKQVVQEFVRKEVRNLGDNTEALAALYQVFAGNWEESIDELVSVSARAGFQMVSTTSGGSAQKDALAGLDRWRETLLLILNNRSPGDANALVSLGKLLSGYGRIEAAHICFLFARSTVASQQLPAIVTLFGGIDEPLSAFSLVGDSAITQGLDFGQDLDNILLSEIYEFVITSGSSAIPAIPHLQAFKLYHAEVLAESGRRTEAQQYCDVIAAAITSKSHLSPYHNQQLMQWVDKLTQRLSQAPADSSSSWKPSMDKVSTSLWGKFNNFIAGGEDSDAASNGSGAAPAVDGQFARLGGETPPLSRAVSSGDMYGSYQPNGTSAPSSAAGNSRYAPGNSGYAPRSSLEQQRPRYDPQAQSAYQPRTSMESTRSAYEPRVSMDNGLSSSPLRSSTLNTYSLQSSYPADASALQPSAVFSQPGSDVHTTVSSYSPNPYQPTPQEPLNNDAPDQQTPSSAQHQPQSNGYQSFSSPHQQSANPGAPEEYTPSSYEPPSTSYEPPEYQSFQLDENPWDAEAPSSPEHENKPKKKMFGDDDDDDEILRRAAALKNSGSKTTKSDADRATEEAFRKAAEADGMFSRSLYTMLTTCLTNHSIAARSSNDLSGSGEKKGWFGGWFKKDPNAAPGPVKAKLGEENSFVYDETLKKWVNKKGGAAAATPTAATPPPPKASGPPSRPSSTFGMPPSRPASGTFGPSPTGAMLPPTSPPMSRSASGVMPPPAAASRPQSSMSNASDADDILGSMAPRPRGAKKAPRKGRYVDVMANQK
jgi:hypothetical protein